MKKTIETYYSNEGDITFIMEETIDEEGNPISSECVGWYYGEPNDRYTNVYIGKLKATYDWGN